MSFIKASPEPARVVLWGWRAAFFVAGLLFTAAVTFVGMRWPDIYVQVFHQPFNYLTQPNWYREAGQWVGALPALSILAVYLLRFIGVRSAQPVAYLLGAGTFYLLTLVLICSTRASNPF